MPSSEDKAHEAAVVGVGQCNKIEHLRRLSIGPAIPRRVASPQSPTPLHRAIPSYRRLTLQGEKFGKSTLTRSDATVRGIQLHAANCVPVCGQTGRFQCKDGQTMAIVAGHAIGRVRDACLAFRWPSMCPFVVVISSGQRYTCSDNEVMVTGIIASSYYYRAGAGAPPGHGASAAHFGGWANEPARDQ